MQNILLDNDLNVYLIDFSETKPRSVVSDFARLEAIFMIEHTPLNNVDEMLEILSFANDFYNCDRFDQVQLKEWRGSNAEIMMRNIGLTKRMRQYADESTAGEAGIVPYYIALLEWVLPIVCYSSAGLEHKRLSAYIAGMLCEKLMELS